jgi:hypothetical protein
MNFLIFCTVVDLVIVYINKFFPIFLNLKSVIFKKNFRKWATWSPSSI